MPELKELLKRIKQLEIRSKRLSNQVFAGEYHSAFKGRGMVFKEVREYVPGDDIRFIDWNVSARLGHPYSKMFEEERALTVMLLIDVSGSNALGSKTRTKRELSAELAAVLAFAALRNNDKVGAIFFSDKVERYIPPKKGRNHVLAMLRRLLTLPYRSGSTNLDAGISMMLKLVHETAICFFISDFYDELPLHKMKAIAIPHDPVAIHLYDPLDAGLPVKALIPVEDAETGELLWIDTRQDGGNWQKQFVNHTNATRKRIRDAGWEYLRFRTDHDFVPVLKQFFKHRIQSRRK